jgi:hypothetical protein
MNCVILQPSYIPWRGYFHLIQKADVFVFYDDVQYDHHGWRNRNRIKTPRGTEWLTIPIQSRGEGWKETPIRDVRISWERPWADSHFDKLRACYSSAPFYKRYRPMLERWRQSKPELLADFTIETTVELAHELGIDRTQFVRSSALGCAGVKTDRLVQVLKKVGATHYISGPAAKEYLEEEKLTAAGIGLEWMVYEYPEYPQLHGPFDPHVSVLDLLMMTGPEAAGYIWREAVQHA